MILPSMALALIQQVATPIMPPAPSRYTRAEIRLDRSRLTAPRLHHAARYALRLTNVTRETRWFAAPAFFARADIVPSRIAYLREGGVKVRPGRSVELLLAAPARPGSYFVWTQGRFGLKRRTVLYVD